MSDTSLPLWFQLASMVIGPALTYAGIVYKQRGSLQQIADQSVAKTIEKQDSKLDKMAIRLDDAEAQVAHLKEAYRKIRNHIQVIQVQAEAIRLRLATYFDLVEAAPEQASKQLTQIESDWDQLFDTLASLLEHTDPIDERPDASRSAELEATNGDTDT